MNEQATAFDEMDPHGHHAGDTHGHVIVSTRTLVAVLVALMVLTILTVFASRFEVWMAEAFEMTIPQWVNVSIAMSIAVVKGLLVVMFFMQLKYDSALNSIIFYTCILAFATFLGFTTLDLFSRDAVDRVRSGDIQVGGTGATASRYEDVFNHDTGEWERQRVNLSGVPVAERARTRERSPAEQRVSAHHDEPLQLSTADLTMRLEVPILFADDHHEEHLDDHAEPEPAAAEEPDDQMPAQQDPGGN